ncbi:MAG: hypothetical protein RBT49_02230 [Bacteroidales bacterium]|nr:hypothetical protein [Bacteroidales bacterium]
MMNTEMIKYSCNLHVDVYENDELINTIDKHNLLLKDGKLLILECLCNGNSVYGNLTSNVFGDSDVTATYTDQINDFGTYHINDTTGYVLDMDSKDNVKIYWVLRESEFNGNVLKTIGLVGGNRTYNQVFNRVNIDPGEYVTKTPYIKLSGYWQIFLS